MFLPDGFLVAAHCLLRHDLPQNLPYFGLEIFRFLLTLNEAPQYSQGFSIIKSLKFARLMLQALQDATKFSCALFPLSPSK